ncbi:hypothetical protein LX16_0238 [Stackebrandtia albiflava]|uniref:Uncharacterized protein n=1 Tax=Stackebrandtia albiflava TaxID=406432 RepID=A0A562V9L3_9ACTN|nr:iron-containing redox enzyme family protein [Stackebrandtia albiflava]TWJ14553.1 hypothetical protein LX16_0238 [Stackebrandtia albiflava]
MDTTPTPRGPLSERLVRALHREPDGTLLTGAQLALAGDPVYDEDLQLSLHLCYEPHFRGWPSVDPAWQWSPHLLAIRERLEAILEVSLRRRVTVPAVTAPGDLDTALRDATVSDDLRPFARHLQRRADRYQLREYLVHESVRDLRRTDAPHLGVAALTGAARDALTRLAGLTDPPRPGRAAARRAVGADSPPGVHIDMVPAVTLTAANVATLLVTHRRLRGALAGQLAAMTAEENRFDDRYREGLRRLTPDAPDEPAGNPGAAVEAAHALCRAVARDAPALVPDVLFGAALWRSLGDEFARYLSTRWRFDGSSLYRAGL